MYFIKKLIAVTDDMTHQITIPHGMSQEVAEAHIDFAVRLSQLPTGGKVRGIKHIRHAFDTHLREAKYLLEEAIEDAADLEELANFFPQPQPEKIHMTDPGLWSDDSDEEEEETTPAGDVTDQTFRLLSVAEMERRVADLMGNDTPPVNDIATALESKGLKLKTTAPEFDAEFDPPPAAA